MAGIITEGLLELKDEDYRAFHAKLIPNIPIEKIIGVRTPVLRKYAKEVAKLPKHFFGNFHILIMRKTIYMAHYYRCFIRRI